MLVFPAVNDGRNLALPIPADDADFMDIPCKGIFYLEKRFLDQVHLLQDTITRGEKCGKFSLTEKSRNG